MDGVISNIENPLGGHEFRCGGSESLPSAEMRHTSHFLPPPPFHSLSASVPSPVHSSTPLAESMTGVGTDTCRSSAVSRLSAAILQSRFLDNICLGSVPLHVRSAVLEKDIRYAAFPSFTFVLIYLAFCNR